MSPHFRGNSNRNCYSGTENRNSGLGAGYLIAQDGPWSRILPTMSRSHLRIMVITPTLVFRYSHCMRRILPYLYDLLRSSKSPAVGVEYSR